MPIKAILFDLDGVLVDAAEWHYKALNEALKKFGVSISRVDHLSVFNGLPTNVKLAMLTAKGKLSAKFHDQIIELKQQYTRDYILAECRPLPIHLHALANLKVLGYQLGVCSNSRRESIELMLSLGDLRAYVDYIISAQEVVRAKPSPDIYCAAMNHFSVQPLECLVVEDSEWGIIAAREAGANLLKVSSVTETNLDNILSRIGEIEGAVLPCSGRAEQNEINR